MNDLKNDGDHYGSLKVKSFESVGDSSATNNTGSLNINDILQQIKVESQSHECMHEKSLAEIQNLRKQIQDLKVKMSKTEQDQLQ